MRVTSISNYGYAYIPYTIKGNGLISGTMCD